MTSLLQLFANGLVFGSIVLLGSIGLSLLFGIGKFANFAHGEFLTIGAYLTYMFKVQMGLPLVLSALLAIAFVGAGGAVLDRTLMARHRDSPPIVLLIVTMGLALVLRSFVRIVWSSNLQSLEKGLTVGHTLLDTTVPVLGYSVEVSLVMTTDMIAIILLGALLALMTHLFLTRTRTGIAMRATSDNDALAEVTGININRVLTVTWILSAALAAIGGIFLGINNGVVLPRMGFNVLLVIFAAVILGGIGSPYGAMAGAYIIGVAQEMSVALPFVTTEYRFGVSFIVMILVLLFKPSGIAGDRW
jgi:branched-chain amino acid transport system permease protein/neutral amino acid transport system permease protein